MPDTMQAAQAKTIQNLPDAKSGNGSTVLTSDLQGLTVGREAILPPWGSRRRERWLRAYDRNELNTLYQGAVAGIVKKVQSSPWEVSGPKSGTQYFQDMLRDAEFGRGWDFFISLTIRDYLRHDIGAFWEVIGPGNPGGPLTGRAIGLAHLDAMNCYLTGDPDYPVMYRGRGTGDHLLHYTRVRHFVDLPDGDDNTHKAVGLCALSRAIALVEREMLMNRYVSWRLDDKPPPGIMLARNTTDVAVSAALNRYRDEQQRDMPPEWGKTVWLFGTAVEFPIELTPITFSEPPDKFDYKVYKVDINVNELALAMGVDVQELWQLSGANIGSAGQSEILHNKSRGKTFGTILKMVERAINDILPPDYEFEFKFKDSDADLADAQIAQVWAGVITQAANVLTPDEQRRILANKVTAIQDAITDEDGQVIRLNDADPVDDATIDDIGTAGVGGTNQEPAPLASSNTQNIVDNPATTENSRQVTSASNQPFDATPENIESTQGLNGAQINAALTILDGVVQGTTAPRVAVELLMALGIQQDRAERMVNDTVKQPKPERQPIEQSSFEKALKVWDDTRSEFVTLVMDAIRAASAGGMNKRRFGVVMRAHLRRLGTEAFKDGLTDGGVDPDDMDDRDRAAVQEWLRVQSPYVTAFASRVFDDGLSDAQVAAHAEMWGNKSLRDAYILGTLSADWNGMVMWKLGATEKHCPDCARLNGQIHRRRDFYRKKLYPGSSVLSCGGFHCDCKLDKAPGERAFGRF